MQKDELKQIIKEALQESQIQRKMVLTVDECVQESGIGRNTLNELIHSNGTDFPYFKVGRKTYINREKLTKWLEKISEEHRAIG